MIASDRLIVREGTPETVWLPWLQSQSVASLDTGLLSGARRLVIVAPHPDDEVLACGGLIAEQVAAQRPLLVVAVTDGEASHGVERPGRMRKLAAQRHLESLQGLACLGAPAAARVGLGLPDGGLQQQQPRLALMLAELLHPEDLVVTTWRLDGHPDHEATGGAAAAACAELGCQLLEAPVWMWNWSTPQDPRVPWHRLRRYPLSAEHRKRKAVALNCHDSQLEHKTPDGPILGETILMRSRRADEYFFMG